MRSDYRTPCPECGATVKAGDKKRRNRVFTGDGYKHLICPSDPTYPDFIRSVMEDQGPLLPYRDPTGQAATARSKRRHP